MQDENPQTRCTLYNPATGQPRHSSSAEMSPTKEAELPHLQQPYLFSVAQPSRLRIKRASSPCSHVRRRGIARTWKVFVRWCSACVSM